MTLPNMRLITRLLPPSPAAAAASTPMSSMSAQAGSAARSGRPAAHTATGRLVDALLQEGPSALRSARLLAPIATKRPVTRQGAPALALGPRARHWLLRSAHCIAVCRRTAEEGTRR